MVPMRTILVVAGVAAVSVATTTAGRSAVTTARVAHTSLAAVVKVAYNPRLKKQILVDGSGRTLYMFTSDIGGKDTVCTPQGPYGAECPAIWPPLTSTAPPRAGKGINAKRLDVYLRRDGKRQVTYNHHPLYYFHGDPATPPGDKKPGDVNGEGFYQEWYVLAPSGRPLRS